MIGSAITMMVMIFVSVTWQQVKLLNELDVYAKEVGTKREGLRVVSDLVTVWKGKGSLLFDIKTKQRLPYRVDQMIWSWWIRPDKENTKGLDPFEVKRINDWLSTMRRKGYNINYLAQSFLDDDIRVQVNYGNFDGKDILPLVQKIQTFLGMTPQEKAVPFEQGKAEPVKLDGTNTRQLTSAEKELLGKKLAPMKSMQTVNKYTPAGAAIISIVLVIVYFLFIRETLLLIVAISIAVVSGMMAFMMCFIFNRFTGIFKEVEDGRINITKVTVAFVGTQRFGEIELKYIVIEGKSIYFPNDAPFNYKQGDIVTVEKFPSGMFHKVDSIAPKFAR